LKRAAIVYVRQSSPEQVRNHGESTRPMAQLRKWTYKSTYRIV
jgi:DNA invertase Pin-like site-specific DNA recombinase